MSTLLPSKLAALQLSHFEKRTHFGKLGRKLKVMTNFFEITQLPQICIYQYVPPLISTFPLFWFDPIADFCQI